MDDRDVEDKWGRVKPGLGREEVGAPKVNRHGMRIRIRGKRQRPKDHPLPPEHPYWLEED